MIRCMLLLALAAPLVAQTNAEIRNSFDVLARDNPSHVAVADLPDAVPGQYAVTLANRQTGIARPRVLVLGSLRGDEVSPAAACLELARAILGDETSRKLLDSAELIIIPVPNPRGRERLFAKPALAMPGTALPFDDDRDGATDEDGPRDVNGDGVITQMRIRRAGGAYVVSPDDPRLMVPAAPGKPGEYDVYWEGGDADGDGRICEDAPGTITLSNDWSIRWNDKQPGANRFMMQQAETRVLADYILALPNLVAAFQLRSVGGAIEFAAGPGGDRYARDGELAKLITEAHGKVESAVKPDPDGPGNVADWLYETQGALAANIYLAAIPKDKPAPAEDKDEDGEEDDAEAEASPEGAAKERKKSEPESPPHAWLRYAADRCHAWTSFQHPDLGEVEIGGWEITARHDAVPENWQPGVIRTAAVIRKVMESMPRLRVATVEVQDKGNGLWRVRAKLHNGGTLNYRTAFAARNRIGLPVFISLKDTDAVKLISGTRRNEHENLQGGEAVTFEWLVRAESAAELEISIEAQRTGDFTHKVAIKDCPTIRTEEE